MSTDNGLTWEVNGLEYHFLQTMEKDNAGNVYTGAFGHYYTGQGGLYKYDKSLNQWDTLFYFPFITSIIANQEDILFLGYRLSGMNDTGGVMHFDIDWVFDTLGINNTGINMLKFAADEHLWGLGGSTQRLYRTSFPVTVNEQSSDEYMAESYCFPNPLTTSTTFSFRITNAGNYNLSVFNQSGKLIRETELGYLTKGNHSKNVNMSDFSSGIYFYSLQQNGITIATNKMVIY